MFIAWSDNFYGFTYDNVVLTKYIKIIWYIDLSEYKMPEVSDSHDAHPLRTLILDISPGNTYKIDWQYLLYTGQRATV